MREIVRKHIASAYKMAIKIRDNEPDADIEEIIGTLGYLLDDSIDWDKEDECYMMEINNRRDISQSDGNKSYPDSE